MQLTHDQISKLRPGNIVYGANPYYKLPQKHTIYSSWVGTRNNETRYRFESTMKNATEEFELSDEDLLFTTASEAKEAWKEARPEVLKLQISNRKFCLKGPEKEIKTQKQIISKLEKELTLFGAKPRSR